MELLSFRQLIDVIDKPFSLKSTSRVFYYLPTEASLMDRVSNSIQRMAGELKGGDKSEHCKLSLLGLYTVQTIRIDILTKLKPVLVKIHPSTSVRNPTPTNTSKKGTCVALT